ncbi:MAG: hypothetical protein K6G88_15270 [Lachnospiraceae bacterium]|nr:hypothetical protein [Lachnospiraceae bacterium]
MEEMDLKQYDELSGYPERKVVPVWLDEYFHSRVVVDEVEGTVHAGTNSDLDSLSYGSDKAEFYIKQINQLLPHRDK